MGNKETRSQIEKPIMEILSLADEKRQRELWRYFLETPMKFTFPLSHYNDQIIYQFTNQHYHLFILFISDVT